MPGSVLITLAELDTRLKELEPYEDVEIIVICRSGNRSGRATKMLRDKGYTAFNMIGGMRAWNKMMNEMNLDTTGTIE